MYFQPTSSAPTIDFEVLRVGETDLEVECCVSPSSSSGILPVACTASEGGATASALVWGFCTSVVIEARAYEMSCIPPTSIAAIMRQSYQPPSFSGEFFPGWKQVGVPCVARAAVGGQLGPNAMSLDQQESFTVRIVGLQPKSTYVVVLAAYPADAYDSGVDARAQYRRCCWMPLRTLALPTYVRCMDRSDSTFRLSVTRPDNTEALHETLREMISAAASPFRASLKPSLSKQHRGEDMRQYLERSSQLLMCSTPVFVDDSAEDTALATVETILTTPLGAACLWRHKPSLDVLTRGAPTASQVYYFRCQAERLRAPGQTTGGLFDDEEDPIHAASRVIEELIPAGDVTVTFSNLSAETMFQVSVTGIERCTPSARSDQRATFAGFSSSSATVAAADAAAPESRPMQEASLGPVARRQSLSVISATASRDHATNNSPSHRQTHDDEDSLRVAPSSSRQPFLVHGIRSVPQYVHTLPRVIAQVERVTPTSAAVSVSRQLSSASEVPAVLAGFSATQRLALLAVGGADEPVVVIARLAKRRMTNMMSMRRGGSAGSRTSRSQSVIGGNSTIRKGSNASTTRSVDFGATLQSAASYGSDDSGSDLDSSDDDDGDDSDPDDVLNQSASLSQTGGGHSTTAKAMSTSAGAQSAKGHAPDEDNRRETGDIMIKGFATPEAPFMIDGLVSNNAYSIHYYTYAMTPEERAEWQQQKDAAALAEATTGSDDDEDESDDEGDLPTQPTPAPPSSSSKKAGSAPLPEEDGTINALRSTFRVDPSRYIGRSLIITPSPQRPLSIAQLGLNTTTASNRNRRSSSVGSRSSLMKSAASSQRLLAAGTLEGDDGYIQNDICYEYKPSAHKDAAKGGGAASYRYRSSVGASTAGSPGALSPIGSPKRRHLSVPRPNGAASGGGSPSPEALAAGGGAHHGGGEHDGQLLDWEDVAKDEALTTVVRAVFRDMNPCQGISLRSITESGAELCFSTDFKRTADRVLLRRAHHHRRDEDDKSGGDESHGMLDIPEYLLEQMSRQDLMARASAIRRTMKFVFCLRLLVLPRGEHSIDATSFASPDATLPMPKVSWEDLEALSRRPTHRIEEQFKIRFVAKYNTHGQTTKKNERGDLTSPVEGLDMGDAWEDLHNHASTMTTAGAAGSPKASALSRVGSMVLSQNALHLLHQTQSELTSTEKVKAALYDAARTDSPDPVTPIGREAPGAFSPKGKSSQQKGLAGGGAMFPSSGAPKPPGGDAVEKAKQPATIAPHIIEATVLQYVFVCGHSKVKLPLLPPDTRYLLSVCGVFAPERPENYESLKAAHEAALEARESRLAEKSAAALNAATNQEADENTKAAETAESTAMTPAASVPMTPATSGGVANNNARKAKAIEVGGMDASVVVPDIDAFTVNSNDSLRTPTRSGQLTNEEDSNEGVPVFGPSLVWRSWTQASPFMTNYVVRDLKILYVHSEGFRFDVNPMLSEIEVNNCGLSDHAALAHVMGAHTQQMAQKYVSAELTCLDDARYSRTVLLERDPTTACFEFIHSLKFDGRYQLRVRVGELPQSAIALRHSKEAAAAGKAKRSRGPSAAVSPHDTDVGSEKNDAASLNIDGGGAKDGVKDNQDEDEHNELEGFLKFGPTGPTTDFVMCYGNVVDVEEIERGLRCFLHPPYAGGHKTEYSVRARKNKLTSEAILGSHLADLADREAFVLSHKEGDLNIDAAFLPLASSLSTPQTSTAGANLSSGIYIQSVCSYLMVGCGSTGLYTSYPILAKELGLNVALLRSLRPDSYNVSVRYLIVVSEPLPSWRFGGRIQQNTHRVRSRSATFEQPSSSGATVLGIGRSLRSKETSADAVVEAPFDEGEMSSSKPPPLETKPTAATMSDLVHQDGAVVLLGRRHTVAATGSKSPAPTKFSSVVSKESHNEGPVFGVGRVARTASSAMAAVSTPRLVTALHAALRSATRYTIGTGTVYRRHEVLPLRIGEHYATLCAVVSAYAMFDLMLPEVAKKTPQLSSNLPSPVAGGDPLTTFLTASQQFTLKPSYRFCDDDTADDVAPTAAGLPTGRSKSPGSDGSSDGEHRLPINRTPNLSALHHQEQQLYYDDTNGTGEILLGMHECPANDFAEPVFSRRGKPHRYPSLPPDANISLMTTVQEQRMSKFLNEMNDDMDRLAFHESAFGGANPTSTSSSQGAGQAQPMSPQASSMAAGEASSAVVPAATTTTSSMNVTAPAALGGQSIAELAAQILKRGDLSPSFQLFRREISGVQVELTLASETSTRQAKVQTYTPQAASTITLSNLLPATEYRVRIRVQGRYNSSIGSSPNWSRWSLPIRFTTQEKLIIQSTFATESAIMLRWVRERSLAEAEEVLSATSASASTFGGSMIGGGDKKHGHHRAPMMDVRISAGIVDQRKYQLPVGPPPGGVGSNSSAGDPALTTPPNAAGTLPPVVATGGGKKKDVATFLTSIYTNVLPFEVEISLLDNNDTGGVGGAASSKKRRAPPSPSDQLTPAAAGSSRREPTVLQQCRVLIPPFLGGLRLKDCFPGMKYSLRVRTTTSRECEAAITALAEGGSSAGDSSQQPNGSNLASLRRRRSSIMRPGGRGGQEDERNVGAGTYSPRVLVSTLSDVMVTLLRLGAAYCTFRIDKLAADMSALKKNSSAGKGQKLSRHTSPKHKKQSPHLSAISDPEDDPLDDDEDIDGGGTADDAHHQLLAKMSHYEVRCRPAGGWVSEFEHKQLMKERLQAAQQLQQQQQQQQRKKRPSPPPKKLGEDGEEEADDIGDDEAHNTTTSPPTETIAALKSPPQAAEDIDESLAVGLEQYATLLIQWRRPTFQGLDASRDVGISANAGAVQDSNAEREVTLDALLPGTMYVLSIRPFIVGQFAGQWVEMVRFSTPEAPKPSLLALSEDQLLFQWKEPVLRHAVLLNQDSARALRAMALHHNDNDTNSVTSGHDDASSLAESSSMASSMVDEGGAIDEGLRHGAIAFTVTAVEIQVRGRFCDPASRKFGTKLQELYDATPEVTLTKLLPITTRIREKLTAVYRQQLSAGGAAAVAQKKRAAARKKKQAAKQKLASEALNDSSSYLRTLDQTASWGEDSDDDGVASGFVAPFKILDDDEREDTEADFDDEDHASATPAMSESTASATSPTAQKKPNPGSPGPVDPNSRHHRHHRKGRAASEDHPQIGLELLLENAFPDATYYFTVRFCDQHQVWSPPSQPWIVVTHPPVDALVLGSGESYAVVRTQRAARSPWSYAALQMLRDYNLFAHDWRMILDKCKESLKARLLLIARYGEDLASGMDTNERSFGDEEYLSKDQLLEELDLLTFEHERLEKGVEGAPVAICSGKVARTMKREFDYLHRDLISRRARRFRFATLDLVTTLTGSVSHHPQKHQDALSSRKQINDPVFAGRARGASEEVTECYAATSLLGGFAKNPANNCATATLQAVLGVLENPAVFDDHRLYDPNCYTVELAVVERSRIDTATRPSRQYLFGRATLAGTLSSHHQHESGEGAVDGDEGGGVANKNGTGPQQHDVVVKRESCDLISVCHLKSGTQYILVTRVNAGHTVPPPASTSYATYCAAQQDGKSASSHATPADGAFHDKDTANDPNDDDVTYLFSEKKRRSSFFDPALQVTAFTSGMWSDALKMETLPNILVQCRCVGFSEVLFEVYRPLKAHETIPDDDAYEEMRSHNRFLALGSRSGTDHGSDAGTTNLTSNTYQLSVNGKHTPMRDMQRFFKGEKKLVHLYKLPPDSAVVVSCRSRFSLDEFLRDAENSLAAMGSSVMTGGGGGVMDGSPSIASSSGGRRSSMSSSQQQQNSVRSWLRPETLARRKDIVFWSNWMPLIVDVRTIPPRPSIPVLYEARKMPASSFRYEGRVPPPERSWDEYVSFWWSVHVDQVNHYPKEIQLDQDMEKYDTRRVGRSGSHTTVETTRLAMPLTYLSQQAKLAQVLLDRQDDEQVQLQDDMLMLSTKYHGDEVVSISDPRGLYVHTEPLLRPAESTAQQHSNNSSESAADQQGAASQQPAFSGYAFEGEPSTYSYEVEMAEFSPELGCFSTFFPVGRTHSAFMRLKLPKHEDHNLRDAVPASARCLFRLRSRVEASDAPGGCVRSLWSPVVSWRAPVAPPAVSELKVTLFEDAPKMLLTFTYPTSPFHNQLVYEILMRESDTPHVPELDSVGASKSGVVQTMTPALVSPVVLGPLRINRYYHVCVRAVTTFGRSEWSRWHSLRLDGKLSTHDARVHQLTRTIAGAAQHRQELRDEAAVAALETYHKEMTSSDWDQETAWCYPFPQSRVMDGFPCPIDSTLHFTSEVNVRQQRRVEAAGGGGGGGCPAPRVDAFPAFVAAGYLRDVRNNAIEGITAGEEELWRLEAGEGSAVTGSRSPATSDQHLVSHVSPGASSPLMMPAVPDIFLPLLSASAVGGGGLTSPAASGLGGNATPIDSSPTHYSPGEGRRKTRVTLVMSGTATDSVDPASLTEPSRSSPTSVPPVPGLMPPTADSVAPPTPRQLGAVIDVPNITLPDDDPANLSLNSTVSDLDATAKPPPSAMLSSRNIGNNPMLITILPPTGGFGGADTPSPMVASSDPSFKPRTMQQFMREFLPTPLSAAQQERLLELHPPHLSQPSLVPAMPSSSKPSAHFTAANRRSSYGEPLETTTHANTTQQRRASGPPSRHSASSQQQGAHQGTRGGSASRSSSRPHASSRATTTPTTTAGFEMTPADRIFGVREDPLVALRLANNAIVVRPPNRGAAQRSARRAESQVPTSKKQ